MLYQLMWLNCIMNDFVHAGKKGYIRSLHSVSNSKSCYWSFRGGDRKDYKISWPAKEEGSNDTTLIPGVFGGKLDLCDSVAWCWKVSCLILDLSKFFFNFNYCYYYCCFDYCCCCFSSFWQPNDLNCTSSRVLGLIYSEM